MTTQPSPRLAPASGPTAEASEPTRRPARVRPVSSFTALTKEVHELGYMRRRYGYYWTKMIGVVLVLAAWVVAFIVIGPTWWQLGMAVVLAVVLTQTAFLGHDAAHRQIFKSGRWNDWVSLIVANLLVGISYGWWQSKHTRHHAAPNKEGADPDIDLQVLAGTPAAAARRKNRVLRWLTAHQGYYFFPLLFLQGLSMHVEGITRVLSRKKINRRWVEATFLTLRLGGLGFLVFWVLPLPMALAFLAVQVGVFGFYLGFSFAPNHIGMPLVHASQRIDFLRRQVLMSRNIAGGWWTSWFFGGLNLQIEHHLFPSIARPHLRKIRPLVMAHCAAEGVEYAQMSLGAAYRQVIDYLNKVGVKGNDPYLCPMVAYRLAPGPGGITANPGCA